MRALSLFSGIGGLDLAAEACGIQPVAFCEIEEFPVSILKKRWPDIPVLPDVRKVNGNDYRGAIDVVFGGFPCQDLSVAGKRAGLVNEDGEQTRSGLWFEMLRLISEIRPRYVVGENVRGAVNLALDTVTAGLEAEGYEVRTYLIPASAVGAPHQRERIFVLGIRKDVLRIEGEYKQRHVSLADTCVAGLQGDKFPRHNFKTSGQGISRSITECGDDCGTLANAETTRLQRCEGRRYDGSDGEKSIDERSTKCGFSDVGIQKKWVTPCSRDWKGGVSESKYQERLKKGYGAGLDHQVAHEERVWRTPMAGDCDSRPENYYLRRHAKGLPLLLSGQVAHDVKNWPTASVCGNYNRKGASANSGDGLATSVSKETQQRGQLNPQWVEQLMGYPDGWTDPDCDEPAPWQGWPARPGQAQYEWEHPRTIVGLPNRAKRLKALGNSVVPQQAEPIFRTIAFIDYMIGGQ